MTTRAKNRRLGAALGLIVAILTAYSFLVIRTRGRMPPPEGLTKAQKVFRGL